MKIKDGRKGKMALDVFFNAGKRGKEKEIGIKRCAFSLFEEKRNTTSEEVVFLSPRVNVNR